MRKREKGGQKFLTWKMRNFSRKSEICSVRIENFFDRIDDPPDLKTD